MSTSKNTILGIVAPLGADNAELAEFRNKNYPGHLRAPLHIPIMSPFVSEETFNQKEDTVRETCLDVPAFKVSFEQVVAKRREDNRSTDIFALPKKESLQNMRDILLMIFPQCKFTPPTTTATAGESSSTSTADEKKDEKAAEEKPEGEKAKEEKTDDEKKPEKEKEEDVPTVDDVMANFAVLLGTVKCSSAAKKVSELQPFIEKYTFEATEVTMLLRLGKSPFQVKSVISLGSRMAAPPISRTPSVLRTITSEDWLAQIHKPPAVVVTKDVLQARFTVALQVIPIPSLASEVSKRLGAVQATRQNCVKCLRLLLATETYDSSAGKNLPIPAPLDAASYHLFLGAVRLYNKLLEKYDLEPFDQIDDADYGNPDWLLTYIIHYLMALAPPGFSLEDVVAMVDRYVTEPKLTHCSRYALRTWLWSMKKELHTELFEKTKKMRTEFFQAACKKIPKTNLGKLYLLNACRGFNALPLHSQEVIVANKPAFDRFITKFFDPEDEKRLKRAMSVPPKSRKGPNRDPVAAAGLDTMMDYNWQKRQAMGKIKQHKMGTKGSNKGSKGPQPGQQARKGRIRRALRVTERSVLSALNHEIAVPTVTRSYVTDSLPLVEAELASLSAMAVC